MKETDDAPSQLAEQRIIRVLKEHGKPPAIEDIRVDIVPWMGDP